MNNQIIIKIGNWKFIVGFYLVVVILLLGFPVFASQVLDPTDIGVGARPLSLGKAFTALSNDGSAIFTNPAGLANNKTLNVISMSGRLMNEVPYTMVGGSYPAFNGTIGIGYIGLGTTGIKETILIGITPEVTGAEGSYTNSAINISYGAKVNALPYLSNLNTCFFNDTKIGANLKLISQGFTGNSTFEAGKGSGYGVDFGAVCGINEETTAGLMIKNLIASKVSGDDLPLGITIGVVKKFMRYNILTTLDAELNRTLLLHVGCEWSPNQLVRLRAGLDQKPSAASTITNLAAGIGFNFKSFTFDYAYHTYAELSEFATHFFSIGYIAEEKESKEVR